MPRLSDDDTNMESFQTPGSYAFSGQRVLDLGATEYTLASLIIDTSGSVGSFVTELENCAAEIIKACRLSPRADNMMMRVTSFNSNLQEINGFKSLNQINPDDFKNKLHPAGSTALHDATVEGLEAMLTYAKNMTDHDFSVNGILVVLTDGEDNVSIKSALDVSKVFANAIHGEKLESLQSILIGVNSSRGLTIYLDTFHKTAGFNQFVAIDQANQKTLAKAANFISKSISAQSQSLGTGGPSQAINPTTIF